MRAVWPTLFKIGDFELGTFGLMAALAFLAAFIVFRAEVKRRGLPEKYLSEILIVGLVGGIVGTVLGLGLSAVASSFISRFFEIDLIVVASPFLIVVTLLGSFALGAFAGLWPAWRASRLPVVDALRYE